MHPSRVRPAPHARRAAWRTLGALVLTALVAACGVDPSTAPPAPLQPRLGAVKFWETVASTRWNERATALLVKRPPAGNAQAAASRILTYLSLAQYRAALAADEAQKGAKGPSVAAAVGTASVAVLSAFFPMEAAALEAQLDADLAAAPWPGAKHEDLAAGEALGRAVGAEVLARMARDNYLVASPGLPPTGNDVWTSSGAPLVRSLYGAQPFFLTSADQLRPSEPPKVGSPEFLAALAEVRAISDARTPEQIAIAQQWNTASGPFTAGTWNLIADALIREHKRGELEAARILAYANAAAFDAQIACFEAKYAYWYPRPTHVDGAITLAPQIALPNHPAYPSGHSCISAALAAVLADAFPSERQELTAMVEEAGLSRIYGGIHYRFDIEAGQVIGERAAALALAGSLR